MKLDPRNLDRRVIYLLVLLALSLPLLTGYTVPPARMKSAQDLFNVVASLERRPGKIAFVAMDFGPNTIAENGAQTEVVVEHLMRRRIPFAVFSQYIQAEPFLTSIPDRVAARLMQEQPGEQWLYGTDWVNLGFRPGGYLVIQSIPKSDDLARLFGRDARGNNLTDVPAFAGVKTLEDIEFLAEFTGLVGMFDSYVQFFQKKDYRPLFGHGCTSITIPEAFIYLDSGQLKGLLEGIAGAAWYSELLQRAYPDRERDSSAAINTGLGVAHLVIVLLIVLGNVTALFSRRGA